MAGIIEVDRTRFQTYYISAGKDEGFGSFGAGIDKKVSAEEVETWVEPPRPSVAGPRTNFLVFFL